MKTAHYILILVILLFMSTVIAFLPIEDENQKFAYITNIETKAEKVNSSHAELLFQINIGKSKGLKDLNLSVKFFDASTNLLLYKFTKKVSDGGEYALEEMKCTVKKSRDYRVRVSLEKDGRIYSSREINILGLSQLPPDEERLELIIKGADFSVVDKKESVVKIRSTYYIESPETMERVRFRIKAIQLESNLLVDDFWEERRVEAGKTNLVQFNMSLVDKYNYKIVLEVWTENHVVDKREDVVKLNPEEYREEGAEEEVFKVEDFVREEMRKTPVPSYRTDYPPKDVPGFETALLLISGGVALWMMRRK